jgi:ATP-dependent helicase/DNAse subunit B
LLIRNSEEYKNKIIGGLYTNNVIDFSSENPSLTLTHPYLKLNGVTVFDDKIIDAIEPNYKNGQTSFVKIDLSKNAPTPKMLEKKELITTDQLDKYIEFTRQKYIECDEEIRKNNFVINPKKYKSSSDDTVCKYCTLKGICFHEFEDVVLIEDSKNKNAEENSDEME